jgi:hypothetical protein
MPRISEVLLIGSFRIAGRVLIVSVIVAGMLVVAPFSFGATAPAYKGSKVAVGDGRGPFGVRPQRIAPNSGNPPGPIAVIGASWVGSPDAIAEGRTFNDDRWSDWFELEPAADHAEDGESTGRIATEPRWVGSVEEVEIRLDRPVESVSIHAVREDGQIRLPGGPSASAAGGLPPIIYRDQWGARAPSSAPEYASRVKMAFVHHTAGTNEYSPPGAHSIVRGIQAFHMDTNGWSDIGYQFLVDKFGQIFEGRGGGVDRPVIGAQAQGFNAESTAVAAMGNFHIAGPPNIMLEVIANLLAWKLPIHGVDPASDTIMTSGGGDLTRYPAGTPVGLASISGHRDTGRTVCPGDFLYPWLGWLREKASLRGAAYVPYPVGFFGGSFVAGGNLDNSGTDELVTGAGESGAAHVRTWGPNGLPRSSFFAYPDGFYGGVRVATARPGATGPELIVTGAGPTGGPHVRTFSENGTPVAGLFAYDGGFRGGVYVAGGNVDTAPGDELITGAGSGGGAHVRVFKPDGQPVAGFFAYPDGFYGGVRVAAGDLDGDTGAEIVTGAGPGGGSHVRVWKMIGNSLTPVSGFFAYPDGFHGGVYVGVVRLDDGSNGIVTGSGEGGRHVRVFRADGTPYAGIFVSSQASLFSGIRVGSGNFESGNPEELAIGGGEGSYPIVRLQRLNGNFLPIGP